MFLCSCFMFLSSINTNRKSNMRFPQRRPQENSSGPSISLGADPALSLPHPPPLLSPPLSPSCSFLPFPPLPSSLVPSPYLQSRPPKIQLGVWGSALSSPSGVLGQSPSRQTIWCILALKSDIIFLLFLWFLVD